MISGLSCIPATCLRKMTAYSSSSLRDDTLIRRIGSIWCLPVQHGSRGALDETGGRGVKSPRRLAVLAALCGTVVLAGWVAAGLAGLGSPGIESTGAPIEVSRATSVTAHAEHVDAPASNRTGRGRCLRCRYGERQRRFARPSSDARPATLPVLFAAVSPTDPVQNAARPAVSSEALDACLEPDVCIDQYLWSLYERTPKVDTVKVDGADQGDGQEEGQDADRRQNSDEVRHPGLRVEGSDSRAESRHVVEGLRDRRHGSGLQTEAVSMRFARWTTPGFRLA